MRRITTFGFGAALLCAVVGAAVAQEASNTIPPPKVMLVDREFVKPGKGGAAHEKAESAFVEAFRRAKWPTHYIAANSLSGKSRALFLIPYDSFEAWEKDNAAQAKNATLSSALGRAVANDGDLLSETDAALLVYDEDQSLRAPVDVSHLRYFEISLYHVRPGHRGEWNDLVKLVKAAYEKIPDSHWATFEVVYGQEDTTFAVFVPMKSLAEVDKSMMQDKDFVSAMGEEGMKKLSELETSAVESTQTNIFQSNPAMSYAPEEWVKGDPEFWKPKAEMKAPAKTETKPAAKQ